MGLYVLIWGSKQEESKGKAGHAKVVCYLGSKCGLTRSIQQGHGKYVC